MLSKYTFDGHEIDSLDLKSLIVTRGVRVNDGVYKEFREEYRLNPKPADMQLCDSS